MKLCEYQTRAIFERYGVPVAPGALVTSAEADLANLRYPVVVKAQIPAGGRGKAGGIVTANNPAEAEARARGMIGTSLLGHAVRAALVCEKVEHEPQDEWYLSILLDRNEKKPVILFSRLGGVEIESHADSLARLAIDPLVGVMDFSARYLLTKAGLPLTREKAFTALLRALYDAFLQMDALLLEINPLIAVGDTFIALDGKAEIDDSALYRHPILLAERDAAPEEDFVKEARSFNFLYIPVTKGGSVAVCSNGSGMLMSCIDMIAARGMSVAAAVDLGGGATKERIAEVMRILFCTPGVKAVLINIFGGITRCDEVAGGIQLAFERGHAPSGPLIVRMEGTNKELGMEILRALPGDVALAPGLNESILALAERRDRL